MGAISPNEDDLKVWCLCLTPHGHKQPQNIVELLVQQQFRFKGETAGAV